MNQRLVRCVLVLMVAFGLVACAGGDHDPEQLAIARSALVSTSGQALFRGIILRDGPVAEMIPTIRDTFSLETTLATYVHDDEVQRAAATTREVYTQVIKMMEARNPGFFETFRNQMLSGDYETVEKGIANAKNEARLAVEDLQRQSAGFSAQSAGLATDASQQAIGVAWATAIAVALVYLVAVAAQEIAVFTGGEGQQPPCKKDKVCKQPKSVEPSRDEFAEEAVVADVVALTAS